MGRGCGSARAHRVCGGVRGWLRTCARACAPPQCVPRAARTLYECESNGAYLSHARARAVPDASGGEDCYNCSPQRAVTLSHWLLHPCRTRGPLLRPYSPRRGGGSTVACLPGGGGPGCAVAVVVDFFVVFSLILKHVFILWLSQRVRVRVRGRRR